MRFMFCLCLIFNNSFQQGVENSDVYNSTYQHQNKRRNNLLRSHKFCFVQHCVSHFFNSFTPFYAKTEAFSAFPYDGKYILYLPKSNKEHM